MKTLSEDAVVIGLGGNVGGEAAITERFRRAREALAELGDVRSAPLYRTAPIGPAQPSFLNSVLRVRLPDAIPGELIATVLEIERLLGRDRRTEVRWGPRTIDLDVLLWGSRVIRTPELEVPHPRWKERLFVVRPLIDLFGEDAVIAGDRLGTLAERLAAQQVELVTEAW